MVVVINENQLKRIVGNITKSNLIENTIEDEKEVIKDLIDDFGIEMAVKYVGGYKNYMNIMFDGDVNKFFDEIELPSYYIPEHGMEMYIHDAIIDVLGLRPTGQKNTKYLGKFVWKSGGINYTVTATVRPVEGVVIHDTSPLKNNKYWKVSGNSGDHGWGSMYYTKKQTIGKRGRQQVFKQIIDKFRLVD
jgi:hypothetical protein